MDEHRLCAMGRPLPENNMWIAAAACQHELILVSRDRHSQEIDGLLGRGVVKFPHERDVPDTPHPLA
jgi:predicted nucleic acid-binding protein